MGQRELSLLALAVQSGEPAAGRRFLVDLFGQHRRETAVALTPDGFGAWPLRHHQEIVTADMPGEVALTARPFHDVSYEAAGGTDHVVGHRETKGIGEGFEVVQVDIADAEFLANGRAAPDLLL